MHETTSPTMSKKALPRYERVKDHSHERRFTPRDGRILTWVYELRFLTREQIQRLEFDPNSARYCRARLRWLFDAGYLDRRRLDLGTGYGANMPVYCLGVQGADWIALSQKMDRNDLDWKPRDNEAEEQFLAHTLAINDFRINTILAARQAGFELEWIDERSLKRREAKDYVEDPKTGRRISVVPDGYFVLEGIPGSDGRSHQACFALELDRGTVKPKSWRQRVRIYRQWWETGMYRRRYKTRSLRVLTVVESARRAKNEEDKERLIRKRVAHLKEWTEREGGKDRFWFTTAGGITPETIFDEPIWQKAGFDDWYALIRSAE